MKLGCGLVFLCCAFAIASRADWQVTFSSSDSSPNELLKHWRTELRDPTAEKVATLNAVVFEAGHVALNVVDQGNAPQSDLSEAMQRIHALAGVNGGYFDSSYAPVGLLVSGGRVLSPLRKAKLLTGVLIARRSKVDIVRQTHFASSKGVWAAVQCGPLLVEHHAPVPGLNETRDARRTFAAVDGSGHASLGVCSSTSLAELGRILCVAKAIGDFKAVRALNLDGGSSSSFWFAGQKQTTSIPESKTVRDFIAVLPQSNSLPQ